MVSLLALPLRYRIGQNGPISGKAGEVVVAPYQEVISGDCVKVAYLNLRRQDGKPAAYGPYLDLDDHIWRKYKEGAPDPAGSGWEKSLREQCAWAVAKGFTLAELDNCDTYTIEVTLRAYDIALSYGLSVLAKNPDIVSGRAIIRHRAVVGIIIEDGWGTPGSAVALRDLEGKPSIPIWFVFFGGARATADAVADMVKINRYLNVGVTFDSTKDDDGEVVEYGGDITDLALPVVSSPPISPTPTERPSMAVPPASNRIWRGEGNERVAASLLMLYDQVDALLPSTRKAANDGTIGDDAHRDRASDHNPNGAGIVTALDITHDPASGFDADAFAESLRRIRDTRLKYVIWNGRIFGDEGYARRNGATAYEWAERNKGPGDHSEHVHVSVDADTADDVRPWVFDLVNANSPTHSVATRPKIKIGDRGPAVVELQQLLGIADDGFFGTNTRDAVKAFQASHGLFVDGIVGSHTWGLLTESGRAAPSVGAASLAPDIIARITSLAAVSDIARYFWNERGPAPIGYIKGMAVSFAYVYAKLLAGDSSARVMAALPTGDTERDALAWYGVTNISAGASTLRALFALLIGLGMRESSGKYWEGLDTNAGFKSADETEAGLFQQSWNSRGASPELPKLFASWSSAPSDGFLSIFREGVPPGSSPNLGGGQGEQFQALCKAKPAFAVECAAIALRVLGGSEGHFGPIRRREAEFRPEAEVLLQQVQSIMDAQVVRPDPIIIPPPKPGNPMPPDAPTPFNAQVEDTIDELRPILAKRFAALQSAAPTTEQVQDDIIRRLGGTPPVRQTQLPPPSSAGSAGNAPAPVPKSGGSLTGFAGGSVISGIIAALMGGAEPIIGTPFGMGAEPTTIGTISGIAGLLSPILGYAGAGTGILNAIRAIGPAVRAFSGAFSGNRPQ